MNYTAVTITATICMTLICIFWMSYLANGGKKK